MKDKCDILILTATFGLGHIFVSKAIREHIKSFDKNINVKIADIFEITTPKLYKGVYKGYEFLIKSNSKIYNYFYYKKNSSESSQMDKVFYKMYLSKFAEYIREVKPKVIVSTFPMCSGLVSMYKDEYLDNTPLITCITDVVDNWEWIHKNTDKYMVATPHIKENLIQKGIDKVKIEVTGIPVRRDFLNRNKSKYILKKYNVENDDFIIMMMGGGMGLLPEDKDFYNWLNQLKGVKTIILTGKNNELYEKLSEYKDLDNIRVLEYTDNISEIMVNSDILITKAGGVTLFEAIASWLPVIVYKPILGQEIENAKFIVDRQIGTVAESIEDLKEKINKVITDRHYRDNLYTNVRNISKNIDMVKLTEKILELYNIHHSKEYYDINMSCEI
jgi:UDP-N-acetylglucosamine:LPS N-acetylglucosamine transferase